MGDMIPFNPLDKINLASSIELALSRTDALPLKNLEPFQGAGVYSLYYVGSFGAYDVLSKCNAGELQIPIYVGKADSKGMRKGGFLDRGSTGNVLNNRLNEHARSIELASNLDIEDFRCRFLVVDDLWISLGESLLISKYAPVWNTLVEGFGNHDPGSGRKNGKRSRWDTVHPGRPWAEKLAANPCTSAQICNETADYLRARFTVVSHPWGDSYVYDVTSI